MSIVEKRFEGGLEACESLTAQGPRGTNVAQRAQGPCIADRRSEGRDSHMKGGGGGIGRNTKEGQEGEESSYGEGKRKKN